MNDFFKKKEEEQYEIIHLSEIGTLKNDITCNLAKLEMHKASLQAQIDSELEYGNTAEADLQAIEEVLDCIDRCHSECKKVEDWQRLNEKINKLRVRLNL